MNLTDFKNEEVTDNYVIIFTSVNQAVIFTPSKTQGKDPEFIAVSANSHKIYSKQKGKKPITTDGHLLLNRENCSVLDPSASTMEFDIDPHTSVILFYSESEDGAFEGRKPNSIVEVEKVEIKSDVIEKMFYAIIKN